MFKKIKLDAKIIRETGVSIHSIEGLPFPEKFEIVEKYFLELKPGGFGGCHSHPRRECFIGIGEGMRFVYKDKSGAIQTEIMQDEDSYLFVVEPGLIHAVKNFSDTDKGFMLEFANGPQVDVSYDEEMRGYLESGS